MICGVSNSPQGTTYGVLLLMFNTMYHQGSTILRPQIKHQVHSQHLPRLPMRMITISMIGEQTRAFPVETPKKTLKLAAETLY